MTTHDAPSPQRAVVVEVTGGVDTHKDTHTAAVDRRGRAVLGHRQFPATARRLPACWPGCARSGSWCVVGVEGTGVYGAGLARYLQPAGVELVEVDRPDRKTRRSRASPTRSTPRPPPAPRWPAGPHRHPEGPRLARSRRCARCGWPAARGGGTAPRP